MKEKQAHPIEDEEFKRSPHAGGETGSAPAASESSELLLALARRVSGMDNEGVHRLALKIRDWDSLLKMADDHRMLPMLFLRLSEVAAAVPPTMLERLRVEYHRNVFHGLANAAELINVLKAFDRAKIPAMPFKGVVLAASIYHDLAVRPAGDLDLLIRNRDLTQATATLIDRGYKLTRPVRAEGMPHPPDEYEFHFERAADGMVVELCWRLDLFQRRFRRNLSLDWVWSRRRTVTLAGAKVPDMSPEIKLLVLCLHGSKHIWSRLIWICDIAQLLVSFPGLDWTAVVQEAEQSGLWRPLALGVLLARRVAGAPVPQPVMRRFELDRTACRLAEHVQKNLFFEPASTPVGRVPYHIQLLGFRDKTLLLLSGDLLRPNERDRALLHLPKALHAGYYLVRPFRILRDKSAR